MFHCATPTAFCGFPEPLDRSHGWHETSPSCHASNTGWCCRASETKMPLPTSEAVMGTPRSIGQSNTHSGTADTTFKYWISRPMVMTNGSIALPVLICRLDVLCGLRTDAI